MTGRSRRMAKLVRNLNTIGEATVEAFSATVSLGGAEVYNTRSALPISGNTAGDQAFVVENNTLYIWNGSGWFSVALLNTTPSILNVQDSDGGTTPFALSSSGAPTTITIIATDSEDDPLTYVADTDSDFAGLATLSQAGNVFTITPLGEDSASTRFGEITFTASDGVNIASSSVQTFILLLNLDWAETIQQAKIEPSDVQASVDFGGAVAISNYTAVVSDPGITVDEFSNAGAAYIFTRSGTTWTQQAKIQASDPQANDIFGAAIAISRDTIMVGAPLEDTGNGNTGSVYIFNQSGSTWAEDQKIQASDQPLSANFGYAIAIDDDTAIIGARGELSATGAAYIFTRSGSTWTQQARIQASDPEASDRFGWSVAISGDTVVVGARDEDTGGNDAGAAYIFTRSGTTWTQQAKIQSSDKEAGDLFGAAVAISGDTVVVSATSEDTFSTNAGAVYVFTRSGSTWTEQAKILANVGFGTSVAIDGDTILVGAATDPSTAGGGGAGAAYIFTRSGSTWTQQAKITSADIASNDRFGLSVGISGETVVVGGLNAEAAYIFVAG